MTHEIPPHDFILPLNPALAGREILEDWYRLHQRLCAQIGNRNRDGETRYIFADEPSHLRRGEAVRIRTVRPEVAAQLEGMGLPQIYPADMLNEDDMSFALSVSVCQTKNSEKRRNEEVVSRVIQSTGLRNVRLDPRNIQKTSYRIRKKGQDFLIPGAVVRFRARLSDPKRVIAAMRDGVGRHRAFGFGLLTPVMEDA